jgi:hypothetical protein
MSDLIANVPGVPCAYRITSAQAKAMAKLIAEKAQSNDLPAELAAAMIVNARAESSFNPNAHGDKTLGNSYGLFQTNLRGVGAGYDPSELMDPEFNIQLMIDELNATRNQATPGRGAFPKKGEVSSDSNYGWYQTEHPWKAWKAGRRGIDHLAAMFMIYVERPRYVRYGPKVGGGGAWGDGGRRYLAYKMFPEFCSTKKYVQVPGLYSVEPPLPGTLLSSAPAKSADRSWWQSVEESLPSWKSVTSILGWNDDALGWWGPLTAPVDLRDGTALQSRANGQIYDQSGEIPVFDDNGKLVVYDIIYKGKKYDEVKLSQFITKPYVIYVKG